MSETPSTHRRAAKDLPLTRLLPNMLTVLSLSAGLTGIRFALPGRLQDAVLAVVIASVFDMLDGRVARMLNIASKFGAELDSLSDLVSFGVAPGLIIYEWALKDVEGIGWIAVLVYSVCLALRLARFNTMLDDKTQPVWAKRYFTGVPAPAGAALALLPLTLFIEFGPAFEWSHSAIALWLILVGGLMVSRLPTTSLKGFRIAHGFIAPLFAIAVLFVAALITNPFLTICLMQIVYLSTLPVGWFTYRRRLKKEGWAA